MKEHVKSGRLCGAHSTRPSHHWPSTPPPQGCHWDLIVLFKDGSRCVVAGAQPEELVPDEIIDALDDSAPFWPGQAVGIRASSQIC